MKRSLLVLVPVALAAALLLALGHGPQAAGAPQGAATKPPWERGDAYLYRRFFTHVVMIGKEADEADAQGMNSQYLRSYFQTTAKLNNSQAILLTAIAADLDVQLRQYDARAGDLQKQRHIQLQKARLNHQPTPLRPPEMLGLKEGREALILQARDSLRQNLGEAAFQQVDDYVRAQVLRQQQASGQAPAAPRKPPAPVADRLVYASLFQSMAYFKTRAQQERDWGLPEVADSTLTIVQRAAGLSDDQARTLDRIATDYLQAYAARQGQLAKALLPYKKLTLDMLARDGKISQTTELAAAAQPAEQIRQQMDALADTAIQQLRAAFGDEAFARFDAFAKQPKKTAPAKPPGAPAAAGQEVTP